MAPAAGEFATFVLRIGMDMNVVQGQFEQGEQRTPSIRPLIWLSPQDGPVVRAGG